LPSDQGGHIVGHRFNPPTEEFNLFAQNGNFNMGAYRVLENTWAKALAEGKNVQVDWQFSYLGSSLRPDRLTVRYTVDGVPMPARTFGNNPGGKP
jgi:hypothetical protein